MRVRVPVLIAVVAVFAAHGSIRPQAQTSANNRPDDALLQATAFTGEPLYAKALDSNGITNAETALVFEPENIAIVNWVVNEYTSQLAVSRAVEVLTHSIRRLGPRPELLRSRARLFIHLRRLDEARADLNAVVSLLPDDRFTHYFRGVLAFVSGDWKAASASLERAEQLTTKAEDRADAQYWLVFSYHRLGDLNAARQTLERVSAKPSEDTAVFADALRMIKGEVGETAVTRKYREDAVIVYAIAERLRLGQGHDQAREVLRKLRASSPWNQFTNVAADAELARRTR